MMLFVGGNLIRRKGWGFAAMVTPVVLLVTGAGFFSFVLFREHLLGYISMLGTTPLMLAVIFGAAKISWSNPPNIRSLIRLRSLLISLLTQNLRLKVKPRSMWLELAREIWRIICSARIIGRFWIFSCHYPLYCCDLVSDHYRLAICGKSP